ncbi:MAG: SAM-dependent methyltransferase [Rubrivivax sp.]|nr:SAM-dependent methyltransferase [Rubrivivax sp.]
MRCAPPVTSTTGASAPQVVRRTGVWGGAVGAEGGAAMVPTMPGVTDARAAELSALLEARVLERIAGEGGWLPFDRYMAMALYEPGLGFYARGAQVFGQLPGAGPGRAGSDFVTAPELSPLFGAALARQVAEAMRCGEVDEIVEFGAGSGALAEQLLDALAALGAPPRRYAIVELPGALRARQQDRLAGFGPRVQWLDAWPGEMRAVVVGNEVLDAMPVKLLRWDGTTWFERGIVAAPHTVGGLAFGDRPTALRPPLAERALPGAVLEVHAQAEAFVATLAARLVRGAAFFIDYGFPEAEYYHPQRHQGTLMAHRAHRSDTDVLAEPGTKDLTAHVNFTAIALAAQEAGAQVDGYTTQAHFLVNCGLLDLLQDRGVREVAAAQKLLTEHEMGELFKVLAFSRGVRWPSDGPLGFARGDRARTL